MARAPFAIGAVVVFVLMAGVGFLPLFGGPGYEHSLATGLIVPLAAAIATARAAQHAATPSENLGRGLVAGLAYAGISLVTAFLHVLRVGICEVGGALLYFALTAGIGAMMGGAWGAVVGEIAKPKRRWTTALLCLAVPSAASSSASTASTRRR